MKANPMFLAIAGLVMAAHAVAQPAPTPALAEGAPTMRNHGIKADKDGDGAISREEAGDRKVLSTHFDVIDADKNGKLSKEELQKFHASVRGKHKAAFEQRFKEADKDGDGALSKSEAETANIPGMAAHFDKADANRDGKVTKDELQGARKRMHDQQAERFKSADKDGDGALTKAEAEAGKMPKLVQQFDRLDVNKDGKIGPEEMYVRKGKPPSKPM